MENIYIISDVHGCYKTLLALIDQFPNKQKSKIAFVGDLIDKGKNTYDVIEFVKNNNYDCVIGNHDEMMILYSQYLETDRQHEDLKYWLFRCGGEATLNSYFSKEKFYEHIEYLKGLPHYLEYENYKKKYENYLCMPCPFIPLPKPSLFQLKLPFTKAMLDNANPITNNFFIFVTSKEFI